MAIFPQGVSNIAARCRNTEDGGAERRVLQQLQRCVEDDYLVWHDVPVGNKGRQPDFVVLHPGRGGQVNSIHSETRARINTSCQTQ